MRRRLGDAGSGGGGRCGHSPKCLLRLAVRTWPSEGRFGLTATEQKRFVANTEGLDETDRRLLAELQDDARLTLAELGRRVGLSSPAVGERLQRLTRDGVITSFRANVDPRALGLALTCVIRIRPAPGQLQNVAALARETPEVVECHRITGDDCYIMRAHLRDVEHLEEVIDRFAVLGQTTTSIVQSSPVPGRGLPLSP